MLSLSHWLWKRTLGQAQNVSQNAWEQRGCMELAEAILESIFDAGLTGDHRQRGGFITVAFASIKWTAKGASLHTQPSKSARVSLERPNEYPRLGHREVLV